MYHFEAFIIFVLAAFFLLSSEGGFGINLRKKLIGSMDTGLNDP